MNFDIRPSLVSSSHTGGKWIGRLTVYRDGSKVACGDCTDTTYGFDKAKDMLTKEIETLRQELIEGGASVHVRSIRHPKMF